MPDSMMTPSRTNGKTPQAVLDKIGDLTSQHEHQILTINCIDRNIAELQEQRAGAEAALKDLGRALDLATFIRDQYEGAARAADTEAFRREEAEWEDRGGAADSRDATPVPVTNSAAYAPPASIKDRVYSVMAWRHGPVKAADIAKELGMNDVRSVAPILGQLSKEKKIKPVPAGGWVRTEMPDLPATYRDTVDAGLGMVGQED